MTRTRQILLILILTMGAALHSPLANSGQASGAPTQQAQRVKLTPELKAGQAMRYQLDFRTTTDVRSEGLAENPQGGGATELRFASTVKLEVLGLAPTRMRVTYEKSAASVRGDAMNPALAGVEEQYAKLQGRWLVLTLDEAGKVMAVEGLEEFTPDAKANAEGLQALSKMFTSPAPAKGIGIGEKWGDERAMEEAPLAGLVVRGESTYLRNEPCRANKAGETAASGVEETCAVILTRTTTLQKTAQRDPTPEEYRERGLRTSGRWNGSGESLTYVSLRTGWVVSATQSGSEEIDYTVATADGSRKIRNFGKVQTQSNIMLLP